MPRKTATSAKRNTVKAIAPAKPQKRLAKPSLTKTKKTTTVQHKSTYVTPQPAKPAIPNLNRTSKQRDQSVGDNFMSQTMNATLDAPSLLQMALEVRAPWEIGLGLISIPLLSIPFLPQAARGDGHPVLVFPGLAANDATTALLRRYLNQLGYDAHGWDMGFNTGPKAELLEACSAKVRRLQKENGRKVSLVGWSLGGLYAREIAKELPDLVRCVVTLGSPFAGTPKATNAQIVYHLLAGHDAADAASVKNLDVAPPVPTSSIYSKSDGIVAWQCSIQPSAQAKTLHTNTQTENIEVQASHLGIGANPLALFALANRLGQAENQWKPFDKSGVKKWLYRERRSELDIF